MEVRSLQNSMQAVAKVLWFSALVCSEEPAGSVKEVSPGGSQDSLRGVGEKHVI